MADTRAGIGWLRKPPGAPQELAGHAFLIAPSVALTCAHVVREHLGLGKVTPIERPGDRITIRLEKMDKDVNGTVHAKGWFPTASGAGQLSDIAIIKLDQPLDGLDFLHVATTMPNMRFDAVVYAAEPGFEKIGQHVDVTMSADSGPRGWRQLNQKHTGFSVAGGFSGAPVTDEPPNLVWGMIVTVDSQERPVSFAITADDLRRALQVAGLLVDAPILGEPKSTEPRVHPTAPIVDDLERRARARPIKFLAFERTAFSVAAFLLIITLVVPTAIVGLAGACLAGVGFVFRWLHANEVDSTNTTWAVFVELYRNSNVTVQEEKQYNKLLFAYLERET
jgi:hypothetical protein